VIHDDDEHLTHWVQLENFIINHSLWADSYLWPRWSEYG